MYSSIAFFARDSLPEHEIAASSASEQVKKKARVRNLGLFMQTVFTAHLVIFSTSCQMTLLANPLS